MKTRAYKKLTMRLVSYLLTCLLIASPLTAVAQTKDKEDEPQLLTQADAFRFLQQATFGPTPASILRVQQIGYEAFLNEQFNAPVSLYPSLPPYPETPPANCDGEGDDDIPNCYRDNYTMYPLQIKFLENAFTREDQLRQRVAWALSQVLVVSGNTITQPSSMSPYQNLLKQHAFGNFRQIMQDMTLNPAMGQFLDMVDNEKPNPEYGYVPNENYARELLQLFTIGLFRLNQDGTYQIVNGQRVPTYTQRDIEHLTRALTGWTYAPRPGQEMQPHNPPYYLSPMVAWEDNHDREAKTIMGQNLPANRTAQQDLNAALDVIFNHPNVGPFIGTRLIQHLVTSNPSPGYVSRVSAAFNNNGQGVRGDMRAVVRAILLDPEARGVNQPPHFGHLREPALFIIGLMRTLNVRQTNYEFMTYVFYRQGQSIFYAPTVFNYYPPNYKINGADLYGPEFAIQTTQTALSRINFVHYLVFGWIPDTAVDLSQLQSVAGNPNQLVESVNQLLMHGTMSQALKNIVINAVNAVPADNTLLRAQTAVYLVASSSQYQVKK